MVYCACDEILHYGFDKESDQVLDKQEFLSQICQVKTFVKQD